MRRAAPWLGLICLWLTGAGWAGTAPKAHPASAQTGSLRLDGAAQQGGYVLGWVPSTTRRLLFNGQEIRFDADGRFAIGFGRDAPAQARLEAVLDDGQTLTLPIAVAARTWRTENLPTLPRVSQPSAEFLARRPAEIAQIEAARRVASSSAGWRQRFIWPAQGRISGLFGSQRIYAGEPGVPHNGVDVAAGIGRPVIAPADGVVVLAAQSPFTLEGHLLMLDHGMGLNSAFLHLSRIDVAVGDVVRQGQIIGAIGMTGRATGPHLHWGMRWTQERIDPAMLAGPMPSAPAAP